MGVHVDSVLVCTIKNQSSHIETKIYKRNEQILWQNQKIMCYQRMVYVLLNPLVLVVYLAAVLLTGINTFQVVIKDWKAINTNFPIIYDTVQG